MAGLLTVKIEPNEIRENKINGSISSSTNNNRQSRNVTIIDLVVLILSVFSIFVDLCTDLVLIIHYSHQGYKTWAIGTGLLVFFPSVVVQFFSLRWHLVENTATVLHWVLHFCMLGIIHRYIQAITAALAAFRSKNSSDIQKVFFDQNDLCMLHLFESFLESAPQLVLQIYVIVMLHEWRFWTGISALASLLSLAWALAAYTKAQRRARANKNVTTWLGLLFQAIWRTGMLTSRVATLVLAAYSFGNYIFLLITIHWISMTIWITYQKTDFCETYWEEKIYNAVVGVIYCFCFFNLQEGQSRWRALAFYLVMIFQNLTCLTIFLMWFGEKSPKLAVTGFITIISGILFGSAGLLFYYRFFHPSGPIKFFFSLQSSKAGDTSTSYSSLTLRSLKRIHCETQNDCHQKSTMQSEPKLESNNKSTFSDSIVIIEENVSDDLDGDIKILQDWINEPSIKTQDPLDVNENNSKEIEADAYKRRPICNSVELAKLLDSERKPGNETATDEECSEVLSVHDYENLCSVNIARDEWGLRSWRGYNDIETKLHDDSMVINRHLDTLTSTNSSDLSVSTPLRESDATAQEDSYATAEGLSKCESKRSSCDRPKFYYLSALEPIIEETDGWSANGIESSDPKTRNNCASTLVATIDEIRASTPFRSRHRLSDSVYHPFSKSGLRPCIQKNWKNVKFIEDKSEFFIVDKTELAKNPNVESTKTDIIDTGAEEETEVRKREANISRKNFSSKSKESPSVEVSNKENILTVASKINHWNRIINMQNLSDVPAKAKVLLPKNELVKEKNNFVESVNRHNRTCNFSKEKVKLHSFKD